MRGRGRRLEDVIRFFFFFLLGLDGCRFVLWVFFFFFFSWCGIEGAMFQVDIRGRTHVLLCLADLAL